MGVEVDVSALLQYFRELPVRVAIANHDACEQAGLIYERFIKEEIKGGHKKGTKTGASLNGPPQNVSGDLRRSVTAGPVKDEGLTASVEIGPSEFYGQYLESGIVKGDKTYKYPFIQPGARKAEQSGSVEAVVIAAWRRGLGV